MVHRLKPLSGGAPQAECINVYKAVCIMLQRQSPIGLVSSKNLAQVLKQVKRDHPSFDERELATWVGIDVELLTRMKQRKAKVLPGIVAKIAAFLNRYEGYEAMTHPLKEETRPKAPVTDSRQLEEAISQLHKKALGELPQLNLIGATLPEIPFDQLGKMEALEYVDLAHTLSRYMVSLGQYMKVGYISAEHFDEIIEQLTLIRVRIDNEQ